MSKITDLTEGRILKSLVKLAVPIIGTSFVQMAYNLTDMAWVGHIGPGAVAAVGTGGFFTWLAAAVIATPRIGAEVGVSQSLGQKNFRELKESIKHSIQLIVVLSLIYAAFLVIFRRPLIGFFKLEAEISNDAIDYLVIICTGMIFFTLNPVFTAIFNGAGDSRTPFRINVIGLITNMILDPLLINGLGPFPRLEVKGAAIATIIAQLSVTIAFILEAGRRPELFSRLHLLTKPDFKRLKNMAKLGLPVAFQSAFFTFVAMLIARIIAGWGTIPVSVEKVGSQIESISWMTAGGFQSAMVAFIGQNYGARKWGRIQKGYYAGLAIVSIIGSLATFLLIFGARPVFSVFIPEAEAISYGVVYLRILGLSQLFMTVEIITAGAFIGQGRTFPPAFVGILFNGLRVPLALWLSSTYLGLDGIWWAITISCVLKGLVLVIWYFAYSRRHIRKLIVTL